MQVAYGAVGVDGGEGEVAWGCGLVGSEGSAWAAWHTYFSDTVGQGVEGAAFAGRGFADEADERVTRHD